MLLSLLLWLLDGGRRSCEEDCEDWLLRGALGSVCCPKSTWFRPPPR